MLRTALLVAAALPAAPQDALPPPALTDLDLENFDSYLETHDSVLVHFWAPCAPPPLLPVPSCRSQNTHHPS